MPQNTHHHQTPARAQKWDALLTCVTTSLMLNACLHYTLSSFRPHSYLCLHRPGVHLYFLDQAEPVAHWRGGIRSCAQFCFYVSCTDAGGGLVAVRLESP